LGRKKKGKKTALSAWHEKISAPSTSIGTERTPPFGGGEKKKTVPHQNFPKGYCEKSTRFGTVTLGGERVQPKPET